MTDSLSYCLKTLAITGVCLGLLGIFNAIIDPYGLLDSRKFQNLNARKTESFFQLSTTKSYQFYRSDSSNVILGSSRPGRAIDPDHSAIRAGNFYNFATPGATPELDYSKLEAAISLREVERVIYFVDFFTFNTHYTLPADFRESFHRRLLLRDPAWSQPLFLLQALRDYSTYFWSFQTLKDSIHTIRKQHATRTGKLSYTDLYENGLWHFAFESNREPLNAFREMERVYLRNTWFLGPSRDFSLRDNAQPPNKQFIDFQSILLLAHDEGLELDIVILPVHARLLDLLDYSGLWESFENWKRSLVAINADVARSREKPTFPLWDFNGYFAEIMEPVEETTESGQIRWFYDPAHPHVDTGDLILDIVSGQRPANIGGKIHSENIEEWLDDQLVLKERYRAENPGVTVEMRESAEKFLRRNPVNIEPSSALELEVDKLRTTEHTHE